MGFINDKTEVINNVALFEVLGNLPKGKTTSSLDSVKSKNKNLLPYLLDLLSTTCVDRTINGGSVKNIAKCEASAILIEILIEFFPVLIRILKEGLAKAIKAGLACNVNFTLPNFSSSGNSVKVKLNIKNLDFNDLLKINPLSTVGSTFFGKDATKDLNWFLSDLIQNGGGNTWKGILDFHYTQSTQEIEIGLNPNYITSGGGGGDKSFDDLLKDFTESIEMITLEGFMAKLTDKLTGSMLAQLPNPPSLDKLISMEQVSALQDKINNSDPCKEDYKEDDYFTFTNDEILKIEEIANQKRKGVTNLDLGCGIVPATVDAQVVKDLFDEIRNTPPSKINAVISKTITVLNDNLTSNVPETDKNVAKASLNAKMLEEIPKILTDIVLEPKIVALYQVALKLVNGPLTPQPPVGLGGSINANLIVSNSFDYAKATKVFFEYVSREALAALLKIIYKKIKDVILRLVRDIIVKQIKDRLKLKSKQLTFLVSGAITSTITGLITTGINTAETAVNEQ